MTAPAIGFIFARGGSKGLPGKNIRPLAGKPLIAHSIARGRASRYIERIIVSTDSAEIAETAKKWGAEAPFLRPAELAQDTSREWQAWQHALTWLRDHGEALPEFFVSLPCTAPLGSAEDVDACIERLRDGPFDLVFTVTAAHRNPYFNMVVIDPAGAARLVNPPNATIYNRQSAPVTYDITTVAYVARPDFILAANGMWDGRVGTVEIPAERALDIDTAHDFRIAELMLQGTGG